MTSVQVSPDRFLTKNKHVSEEDLDAFTGRSEQLPLFISDFDIRKHFEGLQLQPL